MWRIIGADAALLVATGAGLFSENAPLYVLDLTSTRSLLQRSPSLVLLQPWCGLWQEPCSYAPGTLR
jgi:hypothetical protein